MSELVDQAIAHVEMAYQPIVRVSSGSVVAYEALVRTREKELAVPTDLIDAAIRSGRLAKLSRVIRASVANTLSTSEGTQAFVNLHPDDLADEAVSWR